MKSNIPFLKLLLILLLMALPAAVHALDYTYTSDGSAITVTSYTGGGGAITIPEMIEGLPVTTLGEWAFYNEDDLTSVTIPDSITSIETSTFASCSSLTSVNFLGNAPTLGWYIFLNADQATVYYLAGTTGWGATYSRRPTVLWNPQVQTGDASFGVQTNGFCLNITGATNLPVALDACTSLTSPAWELLQSCVLTNGSLYFSDPQWTNYPARFYRVRMP